MRIILGIILALAFGLAQATGTKPPTPTPTAASHASAAAAAGAVSTATGGSLTTSTGDVVTGGTSVKTISFGAPGFSNGALTCEAQIPVLGGTYERESCAILRDAGFVAQLTKDEEAVKAILCNSERIRAAFATVGRPCR